LSKNAYIYRCVIVQRTNFQWLYYCTTTNNVRLIGDRQLENAVRIKEMSDTGATASETTTAKT